MENGPGCGPGLEALSKDEWELFRSRNKEKDSVISYSQCAPPTLSIDSNYLTNLDSLKMSLEEEVELNVVTLDILHRDE